MRFNVVRTSDGVDAQGHGGNKDCEHKRHECHVASEVRYQHCVSGDSSSVDAVRKGVFGGVREV